MTNRLKAAYEFAKAAHRGQERKFTGRAYIEHPVAAAQLLEEFAGEEAVTEDYEAALLHDVVEDTYVTIDSIDRNFGRVVMNLVSELTINEAKKEKEGKRPYLARRLNEMSSRALTIKLCDRLSNISDLSNKEIPNSFVKWYVKETVYILDYLERELTEPQLTLIGRIKNMMLYLKIDRNL